MLTAGEGVIYGSSFVRNMILARMLTKADFGIAAAFAMIITLLEFSAKLGISRFVVRDKEGDQPEFLATAHFVQGAAAVLSTLLMVAAAWPMALLFGIRDHVGALYILATIPLLHGVGHLDVKRFERELRFGPSMWVELVPQVVITIAAWPVAKWLGDYRAVVVLLIIKAVCSCVGSHLLAEQSYRWRMHREYVTRMLRFGWPLIVTGFLMFGVLQGDQFLVATFYTMADLGPYAAAAALTMAPTFFFGRVFNSIALPVMAKVQDDPVGFARRYRLMIAGICAFSATYAAGAMVGAEALMQVVYGKKYAGSGILLAWLGAANAFRNIRIAPAIAAMARGDSINQMNSNIWRVMTLVPALLLALNQQPLWLIAGSGLAGEVLACMASFMRLRRRDGIGLWISIKPTLYVAAATTGSLVIGQTMCKHWDLVPALAAAMAAALLLGGLMVLVLPELRTEVIAFRAQFGNGHWRQWLPNPFAPRRSP